MKYRIITHQHGTKVLEVKRPYSNSLDELVEFLREVNAQNRFMKKLTIRDIKEIKEV